MFTEFWDFAFAWYNVPFTFLLGLCVVLTALQLAGLAADSDAEADFDADGFVTFSDFDTFVTALEAGDASSDFNDDGFLTFEDFDAFVAAFAAGC